MGLNSPLVSVVGAGAWACSEPLGRGCSCPAASRAAHQQGRKPSDVLLPQDRQGSGGKYNIRRVLSLLLSCWHTCLVFPRQDGGTQPGTNPLPAPSPRAAFRSQNSPRALQRSLLEAASLTRLPLQPAAMNQAPRQTTPPRPRRVYARPSLALYCAMKMELFQQPQLLLGAKTVPLNTSISRTGKTTPQPSPKPCSDSYPGGAPWDLPHSCSGQSMAHASSAQGRRQEAHCLRSHLLPAGCQPLPEQCGRFTTFRTVSGSVSYMDLGPVLSFQWASQMCTVALSPLLSPGWTLDPGHCLLLDFCSWSHLLPPLGRPGPGSSPRLVSGC